MKTNYTQNYNTFAGEIDIEDFSTETPNKKRINKYVEADNLEKTIIEKEQQKKEMKNYQSMTLEELREMRLISNTNGRPSSTLTDEKWQKEFNIRRLFVKPVSGITKLGQNMQYSKETGYWNEETMALLTGRNIALLLMICSETLELDKLIIVILFIKLWIYLSFIIMI